MCALVSSTRGFLRSKSPFHISLCQTKAKQDQGINIFTQLSPSSSSSSLHGFPLRETWREKQTTWGKAKLPNCRWHTIEPNKVHGIPELTFELFLFFQDKEPSKNTYCDDRITFEFVFYLTYQLQCLPWTGLSVMPKPKRFSTDCQVYRSIVICVRDSIYSLIY